MIQIGSHQFEIYRGSIQVPKLRVETFTRTDLSQAGAALLPKAGQLFDIETVRHESPSTVESLKSVLDAYSGTIVSIIDNGFVYSGSPYFVNFVVIAVEHLQIATLVRAKGVRGVTTIDLAPAAQLTTRWTLQAAAV